ncbi:MAG: ribbon-helix-helix domain-containing protein [Planctomycetota bacterium]|nr:ribbon-helix-helix domain-containing protein [Planctomycetota bacterium]
MAKVQTAIRIDQELLDIIDDIAQRQGETRTEVILAALERGLYEEQKFLQMAETPILGDFLRSIEKTGVLEVLAKALGHEIDQRKVSISQRVGESTIRRRRNSRRLKPAVE